MKVKLDLTSHIVLNKVPEEFYRPKTDVDRSELTRLEKITTDIFSTSNDGVKSIADAVEA
jgi:glucosamine-6-phosphate deaminase